MKEEEESKKAKKPEDESADVTPDETAEDAAFETNVEDADSFDSVVPPTKEEEEPIDTLQEDTLELHETVEEQSTNSQLMSLQPQSLEGGMDVLTKLNTFEDQMKFAEIMVKSKLVPSGLNSPEKVIVAMNYGAELGVKPTIAVNNIHVINGKPGLSVHLVGTLLKKRGITWRLVKDAVKEMVMEIDKDGNPIEKRDIVTTIEFLTPWFNPETKKIQLQKQEISFTWSDAVKAGYSVKDTWQQMPKVMMRNRCLVIGARFVAPEALNGMYEATELLDTEGMYYDVDEVGNVKRIGKK